MKFVSLLACSFLSALMAVKGQSQCNAPDAISLYAVSNTDVGLGSKMASMNYPGVPTSATNVVIKIFEKKDMANAVHTFAIPENEKTKATLYQFALNDLTQKEGNTNKYTAIVCADICGTNQCSNPSKPESPMDFGQWTLDCKEHDSTVENIRIERIESYSSNTVAISAMSEGEVTKNKDHKLGNNGEHIYWLSVDYLLTGYKSLFTVTQDKKKYCQRKYTISVLTAFVDQDTKQILGKFRFTPRPLDQAKIEEYITQNPTDQKVPIVMNLRSKINFSSQTVDVWHTVCTSAKDQATSIGGDNAVKCSEPFVEAWQVPAPSN